MLECLQKMAASFPQWFKSKTALEVTHCHFCDIVFVPQVNPIQYGRGSVWSRPGGRSYLKGWLPEEERIPTCCFKCISFSCWLKRNTLRATGDTHVKGSSPSISLGPEWLHGGEYPLDLFTSIRKWTRNQVLLYLSHCTVLGLSGSVVTTCQAVLSPIQSIITVSSPEAKSSTIECWGGEGTISVTFLCPVVLLKNFPQVSFECLPYVRPCSNCKGKTYNKTKF